MNELIGKRFELTEVVESDAGIVGLTLVGNDEVIRLEADEATDYLDLPRPGQLVSVLRASIESLVDPPSEEVKTDVYGGNFVAAPPAFKV